MASQAGGPPACLPACLPACQPASAQRPETAEPTPTTPSAAPRRHDSIGKLASKETPPPTDDEKADATPVQEGPLLHGVLTTADVEHIRQLFEASDDDGSGHVDEKEFEGLVKKLCKEDKTRAPGHKDLLAAFTEADVDGGGHVDLDEFMALYARVKKGEVKGLGGGFFGKKKKLFTPEELASKRLVSHKEQRPTCTPTTTAGPTSLPSQTLHFVATTIPDGRGGGARGDSGARHPHPEGCEPPAGALSRHGRG